MSGTFSRALAGFGAKVRGSLIVVRDLPGVAALEGALATRGGAWSAAFETELDRVSLALFGVTPADTRPPEPHPDRFDDQRGSAYTPFSDAAFASYGAALEAWYDWQVVLEGYDHEIKSTGMERYWRRHGFDIAGDDGADLRCLPYLSLPLYVAVKGLLPGARLTPDGGGRRVAQSVEEWGAAMAAEAARFRSTR